MNMYAVVIITFADIISIDRLKTKIPLLFSTF